MLAQLASWTARISRLLDSRPYWGVFWLLLGSAGALAAYRADAVNPLSRYFVIGLLPAVAGASTLWSP